MNQIIAKTTNETQLPTTSDPMISMIERAARDPNIDIEKLERLLVLQEKAQLRVAETAFNGAMSQAQSEMGPIAADSNNPQTKSRYASYFALDKELRPIYTAHGFALSFDTGDSPLENHIRMLCYVSHSGGFTRVYHVDMPADGKGAKGGDVMTKTHAVGSGMTYGQRYLLKGIFNIAIGSDDDGNAASPKRAPVRVPSPSDVDKPIEDSPVLLTPFKTEKFPQWAERFVESVNTAKSKDEVAAWETLNGDLLGALPDHVWKPVESALLAKVATFDKPAPKFTAPTTGPQKVEPQRQGPDLKKDYDGRVKWVLNQIKDADGMVSLGLFWDNEMEPDRDGYLPPDWSELCDAWERRKLELEGEGS